MLCLALLGGTINTALAQQHSKKDATPEEHATKKTAKLTETLSLNAEQQERVYSIVLDHAQKKEALKNAKLTEDERRDAKKELYASFEAQLKGVLTADQYQKYSAKKEEMKKEKHGDHKGHGHENKK